MSAPLFKSGLKSFTCEVKTPSESLYKHATLYPFSFVIPYVTTLPPDTLFHRIRRSLPLPFNLDLLSAENFDLH